ncbi:MAG: oligosaccharide flippase family protein [Paludibacteraceae bacterium]|nr:oligosaccharide flippase family protein [Paludibacteraceae bacterium]
MTDANRNIDSKLILNSVKLLTASGVGQFVAVVIYPLVTRLYSPDELGNLSLFLAIVGVGVIMASAQYENAVVIEKDHADAATALDLCVALNVLCCVIVAVVSAALTFSGVLSDYWSVAANCLAPLIFLSSLGYVLSFWWNRNDNYGKSAVYSIVHSVTNSVSKVLLGFVGWHKWGLVISAFVGQVTGIAVMFFRKRSSSDIFRFSPSLMAASARRHKAFALFTMPHKLVHTLTVNMPVFVISAAFDMVQVGFFALALNVALKPMWAYARAMNQVLFQRVGKNEASGEDSSVLLRSVCRKMVLVFIPSVVVVWMVLPWLTGVLFGEGWATTGDLLRMMLPWIACSFMAISLNFVPSVYGRQKEAFVVECVGFGVNVAALAVGAFVERNVVVCVSILSMVNCLYSVGQICWYLMLATKRNIK